MGCLLQIVVRIIAFIIGIVFVVDLVGGIICMMTGETELATTAFIIAGVTGAILLIGYIIKEKLE